jgi:hypothetical protein
MSAVSISGSMGLPQSFKKRKIAILLPRRRFNRFTLYNKVFKQEIKLFFVATVTDFQ